MATSALPEILRFTLIETRSVLVQPTGGARRDSAQNKIDEINVAERGLFMTTPEKRTAFPIS